VLSFLRVLRVRVSSVSLVVLPVHGFPGGRSAAKEPTDRCVFANLFRPFSLSPMHPEVLFWEIDQFWTDHEQPMMGRPSEPKPEGLVLIDLSFQKRD